MKKTALAFAFSVAWLASLGGHVSTGQQDHVRTDVQQGRLVPLADILQRVQSKYPGRVLEVELEKHIDGQRWYEIKILRKDGRKVEVHIDATTGVEVKPPGSELAGLLPMAEAVRRVVDAKNAIVLKACLERWPANRPIYEIHLLMANGAERTLRVDAVSGSVITGDHLDRKQSEGLLPVDRVLAASVKQYGGIATEIELKQDTHGRLYYEVALHLDHGRALEVNVDAKTGKIIGHEEQK